MTRVHFEEKGSGPLLVCLHGIGSSSTSFAAQLEGLAPEMRVVAWDAPGYGASPPPDGPMDMAAYADAAASLIRALGQPAYLLGVSWGGVIAAHMALSHREMLKGLILVSASRGSGRDPASSRAMKARIEELDRLGPTEFARRRAPALVSADAPPALVDSAAAQMAAAISPAGYRAAASAMAATDLTPHLGGIDLPTVVICGSDDTVTGRPESEALAAGIAHSTLVVLHGCGHIANQEASRTVNEWVASFVAVVEGQPVPEWGEA